MKVLLIRREADSLRTAALLEQNGFSPILLPLFLKSDIPFAPKTEQPQFLVFTSAAGAESVSVEMYPNWAHIPAYSVGPRTSQALKQKGYTNIHQGDGSAADLAHLILKNHRSCGHNGIYCSGVDRAFDMQLALNEGDIKLETLEVYRIDRLEPDKNAFIAALEAVQGDAIFLYSPRSTEHFLNMVEQCGAVKLLKNIEMIAISEKTAVRVDNNLVKSLHISDVPNEDGLMEKAKSLVARRK